MRQPRNIQAQPFNPPPVDWRTVQSFKAAAQWYAYQPADVKSAMPPDVQLAFSNLAEMTGVKL